MEELTEVCAADAGYFGGAVIDRIDEHLVCLVLLLQTIADSVILLIPVLKRVLHGGALLKALHGSARVRRDVTQPLNRVRQVLEVCISDKTGEFRFPKDCIENHVDLRQLRGYTRLVSLWVFVEVCEFE